MDLLYIFLAFVVAEINSEFGRDEDDEVVSYRGYQIWRLNFQQCVIPDEVVDKINEMRDVLGKNDEFIDFLLSPSDTKEWNQYLYSYNITYEITTYDVEEKIEQERFIMSDIRRKDDRDPDIIGRLNFTSFPRLHDLEEYYARLKRQNPWAVKIITAGLTNRNTSITCIILSDRRINAPAILIDGGMHGREWTSVFSVLYFLESIAWNFTSQPEFIRNKMWFIIPILNPDGYEYSMTKDRLWSKNRRRFSGRCDGVDINRNFDVSWCDFKASIFICSNVYCGPLEFSERESSTIRDLFKYQIFSAYVTVHSYGSRVMYPYPSQELSTHQRVTDGMAAVMRGVVGQYFRATAERSGKEYGAGTSVDWMYFVNSVAHSYVIETRGGDYFVQGDEMEVSGLEVAAALRFMAQAMG
ncbi:hypothetical protein K1T71_011830 [Dendrolimus kikuchii]|uniref:Uncharacterized protein n=1 Tax=Dendrolimus kikuchii TaxID=765133 RepID=A0ACC1CMD9_9NEOP|nr:hypothetical protein K1T71_011830 [Dendrolimus kikuchii]